MFPNHFKACDLRMPFGSGDDNVCHYRVSKSAKYKKWRTKSESIYRTLLVIREVKYDTDLKTGYGLFAPGDPCWPPPQIYSKKLKHMVDSKRKRKVVIHAGDIVTGFAGVFGSRKDKKTSKTHTAPAADYGLADGETIRNLIVDNLKALGKTHLDLISSHKFNLAHKDSKFHISWDMTGVLLNSSFGSGVEANVSNPCQAEATTFHIASSDVKDRRRVSPRFMENPTPNSFIMMPMYALRDIYEGEQLFWCYPWRIASGREPPTSRLGPRATL